MAIVLPAALLVFTLLVVNLIGLAGDMLVTRDGLMLAVQDGAGMARAMKADEAGGLYGLADEGAVRQMVDHIARENLEASGYDPSVLDGALNVRCEAGSGPCIYVDSETGCGRTDPLEPSGARRCGPFVSLRVEVPVRLPLGGSVTHTFHVASGTRVTRTGEEPAPPAGPDPTPTPVERPVGW